MLLTCSPAFDDLLTDFFPAAFPLPRPDILCIGFALKMREAEAICAGVCLMCCVSKCKIWFDNSRKG